MKCQCGQPDEPWHDCGDKPEGKLVEFAIWFNTGDPQGREDFLRLLGMFEEQQTLNAKLVAALEDCWNQFAIPGKNGKLWAGGLSTLENVEALLKEAKEKAK